MKLAFHPQVFAELDTVLDYYEGVAGKELADAFYREFLDLVHRAAETPEPFSLRDNGLRRANLPRIPYNFLFRARNDRVRILVLRHHARNPSYGEDRV